ncbi:hypothetical protein [uncultured Jannaschia sp.]|uniref:hypothetical protein n=1 Tax=uncultured Jannaschia sp. TaxID=293347 RepID=UPI00260D1EA8|nr:hypothetical protein [uncultured Jannaschia sp.]
MIRFAPILLILAATPALSEIVPRDGTWQPKSRETELAPTCPPFAAGMAEMMAAGFDADQPMELAWNGRFDPNLMSIAKDDSDSLDWTRQPDGSWVAAVPGMPAGAFEVTMAALSPVLVESRVFMDIEALMKAEGEVMPGMAGCTLAIEMTMEYAG